LLEVPRGTKTAGWKPAGIQARCGENSASALKSGSRPGEKRRRIEGATNRLVAGPPLKNS